MPKKTAAECFFGSDSEKHKKCCCHGMPMWMCPAYRQWIKTYTWFRSVELRCLDCEGEAFQRAQ